MSNQTNLCPTCSTEVSSIAVSCPKCGRPLMSATSLTVAATSRKEKGVLGICTIFGWLGLDHFYLGNVGKGIATLLVFFVCILLSFVVIGAVIIFLGFIFNVIRAIMIFSMSDEAFNQKYNRG